MKTVVHFYTPNIFIYHIGNLLFDLKGLEGGIHWRYFSLEPFIGEDYKNQYALNPALTSVMTCFPSLVKLFINDFKCRDNTKHTPYFTGKGSNVQTPISWLKILTQVIQFIRSVTLSLQLGVSTGPGNSGIGVPFYYRFVRWNKKIKRFRICSERFNLLIGCAKIDFPWRSGLVGWPFTSRSLASNQV